MQVKIRRHKADKDPMVFDYDFGSTIEEAIEKFDGESPLEKVVYGLFVTAAKQQLAEYVRQCIEPRGKNKKPMTLHQIQTSLESWKPAVEKRASANVNRAAKMVNALTAEERAALKRALESEDNQESQDFESVS